ncbi:MAG TPA: ROK family protein [Chthoniobacteraceae bacterium]|nr:ROK family protein [Chthoniobacteraceae bacterium]
MHLLAIEIGGSKLQIFAGDDSGRILERRRFVVDHTAGGEGIRRQIAAAFPELIAAWSPLAIGVGFGGPVRWRSGEIAKSHHVSGWSDFPMASWVRDQTELPVAIDNDANVAALGEALHGAGRGQRAVFYLTLGSGVGGGLVVDGKIYHGAAPGEVEIGHVRLDASGTIVEERCSGWAVDRRIREVVTAEPDSMLAKLVREATPGCEARHLPGALAAQDPFAESILDAHADTLAFALSHVVHLLHPDVIVIGGGLTLLGEAVRARLATVLPKHLMSAFQPGPAVVLAALGEDAVPVGALSLAARALSSAHRG